jgi:hypothetical protein
MGKSSTTRKARSTAPCKLCGFFGESLNDVGRTELNEAGADYLHFQSENFIGVGTVSQARSDVITGKYHAALNLQSD